MKQLQSFKQQVIKFAYGVTSFNNTVTFLTDFNIDNEIKEVKVTVKFDGFGGYESFATFNKDGHRSQDLIIARKLSKQLVDGI